MSMPERVTICEVGTRDGFQIEPEFIATETKIDMVNRLAAAGLPRIEVTSFVHPKAVPQMRDAAEVMAGIERRPGTVYAALIPNDKGAARAVEAGVDKLHTVLSASESHNLANVNMTVAESLDKLAAVAPVAHDAGIPVQGGISTAFGCPFEGRIPLEKLESIASRLVDLGFRGISLADTTGMANPAQVRRILEYLMPKFPGIEWNLHTHNTRSMAIPNILAAMACGVESFDSSIAGRQAIEFRTSRMIFGIVDYLVEITKYITLHPGDVLWMGTEGHADPIRDGDTVDIEITGIGTLSNPVIAASPGGGIETPGEGTARGPG